jgi:hypothetical protein
MAYSKDKDLVVVRPDILSLGVETWSAQAKLAEEDINRYIDVFWYRGVAVEHGFDWKDEEYAFDATRLLSPERLKKASIYLTLAYAYGHLTKNTTSDGFAAQRDTYQKLYDNEIKAAARFGLDYAWPEIGDVLSERRMPRKLVRG